MRGREREREGTMVDLFLSLSFIIFIPFILHLLIRFYFMDAHANVFIRIYILELLDTQIHIIYIYNKV